VSFGSPPPRSRSGLGLLGTFQPALPCGISFIQSVCTRYYIRCHDTYCDTTIHSPRWHTILRPDDVNHAALLDHAGPQVFLCFPSLQQKTVLCMICTVHEICPVYTQYIPVCQSALWRERLEMRSGSSGAQASAAVDGGGTAAPLLPSLPPPTKSRGPWEEESWWIVVMDRHPPSSATYLIKAMVPARWLKVEVKNMG
jgi:hypothetical protein